MQVSGLRREVCVLVPGIWSETTASWFAGDVTDRRSAVLQHVCDAVALAGFAGVKP